MPRVYVETTILSFLAARPSRDVVIAGKQETTRLWWELRAPRFELFVSPFVWDEAALGDSDVARRRCELLRGLAVLAVDAEATRIAEALVSSGSVPAKAATDASHIAVAPGTGWISFSHGIVRTSRTHKHCRTCARSLHRSDTNCPRFARPTN